MRAIVLGGLLVALAACADGPSRSFTWLVGQQSRWLNDLSACTDDGSAVFFQRASDGNTFPTPGNLNEEKCARALEGQPT